MRKLDFYLITKKILSRVPYHVARGTGIIELIKKSLYLVNGWKYRKNNRQNLPAPLGSHWRLSIDDKRSHARISKNKKVSKSNDVTYSVMHPRPRATCSLIGDRYPHLSLDAIETRCHSDVLGTTTDTPYQRVIRR